MKSVRFDAALEARLERAARALSVSQSEFLRDAVSRHCDEVLGRSLADDLAPFIGSVNSKGGRAADTGKAFAKAVVRKHRK